MRQHSGDSPFGIPCKDYHTFLLWPFLSSYTSSSFEGKLDYFKSKGQLAWNVSEVDNKSGECCFLIEESVWQSGRQQVSEWRQHWEGKCLSSGAGFSGPNASMSVCKLGLLVNRSPLLLTCLTASLLCFPLDPHGLSLLLSPSPSGHSFLSVKLG